MVKILSKKERKPYWLECKRKHRAADRKHEVLKETTFDELLAERHKINTEYYAKIVIPVTQ